MIDGRTRSIIELLQYRNKFHDFVNDFSHFLTSINKKVRLEVKHF